MELEIVQANPLPPETVPISEIPEEITRRSYGHPPTFSLEISGGDSNTLPKRFELFANFILPRSCLLTGYIDIQHN
jgi:hypothetical protein